MSPVLNTGTLDADCCCIPRREGQRAEPSLAQLVVVQRASGCGEGQHFSNRFAK